MAEWLKAVDSKSIRGPKSPLGGSNPSLSANFFKSHLNQIYLRNSGSIEEMPCNGQWQVHKPRESTYRFHIPTKGCPSGSRELSLEFPPKVIP